MEGPNVQLQVPSALAQDLGGAVQQQQVPADTQQDSGEGQSADKPQLKKAKLTDKQVPGGVLCESCGKELAKYRCPGCARRRCGIPDCLR